MVSVGAPVPKQAQRRVLGRTKSQQRKGVPTSLILLASFVFVLVIYGSAVAYFSSTISTTPTLRKDRMTLDNSLVDRPAPSVRSGLLDKNDGGASGFHFKKNDIDESIEKGIEKLKQIVPKHKKGTVRNFQPKAHGEGIKPQVLAGGGSKPAEDSPDEKSRQHPDPEHVMKAYVEPIHFDDWEKKPLPVRTTASADQLDMITFPKVNSCKNLPERWPADEYPDQDTFLPWIHDVFPTNYGKFIQFVAQNRRRCHTGTSESELKILFNTQPSVALFQHVPVKRVEVDGEGGTRYRLSTHEDADPDGVATRFICRFKPSMEETLSVFNFDYDWAAHRKRMKHTFKFDDGGIKSVHTSQLIFQCPVPEHLVQEIRTGDSVKDDFATLFVDVIPIRTPPRYGHPTQFLQPKYNETPPKEIVFDPKKEWGEDHILPKIEDSGRWENIPICRPSLQEFEPEVANADGKQVAVINKDKPEKKHRLAACMWASAGYATRGNRFAINDGQRRLLEWIHLNRLTGFDHFYLYDNSYAFSDEITLKPIADLFPGEVTYIKWPFQVCNNNPNNVDSPGERSSQYAAESSCRLRFGPHVEWIGQFDIDEYLLPMGNHTSLLPILDKLDEEGKKMISFGSWRSWPRRDYIAEPERIDDRKVCGKPMPCFELQIPLDHTILQTYNCDRQSGPKKKVMPAEKQIYRPDYVKQHFIHYSAVTVLSDMNQTEFEKAGFKFDRTRAFPDPNSRFGDELHEASMLHTKAVATQDTVGWLDACMDKYDGNVMCRIGVPYPDNYSPDDGKTGDEKGWGYNCYVNKKTEEFWVPNLDQALKENHGNMFDPA